MEPLLPIATARVTSTIAMAVVELARRHIYAIALCVITNQTIIVVRGMLAVLMVNFAPILATLLRERSVGAKAAIVWCRRALVCVH